MIGPSGPLRTRIGAEYATARSNHDIPTRMEGVKMRLKPSPQYVWPNSVRQSGMATIVVAATVESRRGKSVRHHGRTG